MKLWVLSDMHADRGIEDIAVHAPDFDAFICAGDVLSGDIGLSIEMVAAIASGKSAIFVAGNHEWSGILDKVLYDGRAAADKHGVHWLELDAVDIGGIRFVGATLWTPDDVRYTPSVNALARANADVVVTHYPPSEKDVRFALPAGGTWIYGHHHGFEDYSVAGRRVVRNALGYGDGEELVDSLPAREDFVIEIGT